MPNRGARTLPHSPEQKSKVNEPSHTLSSGLRFVAVNCGPVENQRILPAGVEASDVSSLSGNGLRQSENAAQAKCNAPNSRPAQTGPNESEADNVTGTPLDAQQTAELRLLSLAWSGLTAGERKSILAVIAKANKRKRQRRD